MLLLITLFALILETANTNSPLDLKSVSDYMTEMLMKHGPGPKPPILLLWAWIRP